MKGNAKENETRKWDVVVLLNRRGRGSHGDARKQESKAKARKKVDAKKEGW